MKLSKLIKNLNDTFYCLDDRDILQIDYVSDGNGVYIVFDGGTSVEYTDE